MLANTTKCSTLFPALSIDHPIVTTSTNGFSYAPLEGIRACINNTFETKIYLPGCSVFSLHQGDVVNPERQCFWEGFALELEPTKEYCSKYDLSFHEAGDDYYITAQYCKVLQQPAISENDTDGDVLPPIFEQDCQEIYTMSSNALNVACPRIVDCFPKTDQPRSLICSHNLDLFTKECPNTMILH